MRLYASLKKEIMRIIAFLLIFLFWMLQFSKGRYNGWSERDEMSWETKRLITYQKILNNR